MARHWKTKQSRRAGRLDGVVHGHAAQPGPQFGVASGGDRSRSAAARAVIASLYDGKALTTGEPFLAHADGIVEIVRELRDDADLLAAAYLFGVHDVLRDPEEWLRSRFGASVAQLVSDLRILMRLSERTRPREGDDSGQAEALRQMLLAMVNDLRVVLLRLASRLQTLRFFVATRRTDVIAFARETIGSSRRSRAGLASGR